MEQYASLKQNSPRSVSSVPGFQSEPWLTEIMACVVCD